MESIRSDRTLAEGGRMGNVFWVGSFGRLKVESDFSFGQGAGMKTKLLWLLVLVVVVMAGV